MSGRSLRFNLCHVIDDAMPCFKLLSQIEDEATKTVVINEQFYTFTALCANNTLKEPQLWNIPSIPETLGNQQ